MKIETYGKSNGTVTMQYCRISCDTCTDEVLEYQGGKDQAAGILKTFRWTIGSTGLVRGPECTKRHLAIVQGAIRSF